ncbi:high affinity sulphate transporter 1 [Jatrophihabitans sp. GAS493]|uniref:SulP family inorganic anion transporter n=1 Tax=Jatrophihabitans sp. GAS493 TaxID=1907575 RepID=UPI000BB6C3F9|nr:SulP family inorganic anion transporter [Jatrophihabitans sp. GAS493]SOD72480.1 high affinity sulphate transporter 1 [Jatrophihabitans sp. GAS493]
MAVTNLRTLAPAWMRHYRRDWLRADVVAGLTAGAVVIPQAMAYATIAGEPVQVGLYTCLVPMVVYALTGGSRAMSFSTTSTIATLTAATLVAAGVAASSTNPEGALSTLTLLVGVLLIVCRVLHIGNLINSISDALLLGLKVGVGLTVALGQLPKLLGIAPPPEGDGFFRNLWYSLQHLSDANLATVLLGFGSVAVLLILKQINPRIPGPLVAVVGGILLSSALHLDEHGVAKISKVPSGLPLPQWPSLHHLGDLLPGAIAITLMAALETISVARSIRHEGEPPIDNDQELFANAAGTFAGAFFQALPAAGGFSQSAVNSGAGAKTQVSQLVTVVLAILTALFLGPVLSELPQATLGAVVVVATLGLISVREIVALARFDPLELAITLITAAVALVSGLLVAVAVGVALTFLLVLVELNKPPVIELGARPGGGVAPLSAGGEIVEGLLILRVGAPLYTANVRAVAAAISERVAAAGRPLSVVLLDATAAGTLSMTILSTMLETQRELNEEGIGLWASSLSEHALAIARRAPNWKLWAAEGRVWPTAEDGVAAFRARPAAK